MTAPLAASVVAQASAMPAPLWRNGPAPANDDFANAEVIPSDTWIYGDFIGTTVESGEFTALAINNTGDPSVATTYEGILPFTVWYKWIPPEDGNAHFEVHADTDLLHGSGYVSAEALIMGPPTSGAIDQSTVLLLNFSVGFVAPTDTPVSAGVPVWIQMVEFGTDQPVGSDTYDAASNTDGHADFRLKATMASAPPDLAANVEAPATLVGRLGLPEPLATTVSAHATAIGSFVLNSAFAGVLGRSEVEGTLGINANPHVEPYFGDPPGSGYVGTGDLISAPAITVVERIGAPLADDARAIDTYLNLITADEHSGAAGDFAGAPLATGATHSVERWFQVRIQPPFNSFAGLRAWVENAGAIADGWTLNYGTANDYAEPSASLSAIATTPMPTADPGPGSPNMLDAPIVHHATDEATSLWLVLQAVIDPSTAPGQPIGYLMESWSAAPVHLRLAWTET